MLPTWLGGSKEDARGRQAGTDALTQKCWGWERRGLCRDAAFQKTTCSSSAGKHMVGTKLASMASVIGRAFWLGLLSSN
jgi:hypothetical protein